MINIDFLTIKAFLVENADFIINSVLQKIQQPSRREFILHLRNNSKSRKLYINIFPETYHIAFINPENETRRGIKIPKHPPMFCMLLRKYLESAKIIDARVVDNERILEFLFDTYDELGQIKTLCLCIELMGKHSNVILYEKENYLIIGCAHNISAEKSRYRELKGGLKYIYPPNCGLLNLSTELKSQFKNLPDKKIQEYLKTENYTPAINGDKYTLFSELLPGSIPQNSINDMLDNYYSKFQETYNLNNSKNKLINIIKPKLNKVNSSFEKITILAKKRNNAEVYKHYGELLTSNLYIKADFQENIEIYDYISNKTVKIDLDPSKTMSENAQSYFKLYTKSKNSAEKSKNILNSLEIEKHYLESVLYSIESAVNIDTLEEIYQELGLDGTKQNKKSEPPIEKIKIDNFDIFIGKNNKQNDYIISKLSKDEDYWFHTRLCAGSHVLLKVNGKEPSESVLYECAKLARKFSSAKQPSKVGVIFTKRKYIKKPPSSPLGYVTYKNEKEFLV